MGYENPQCLRLFLVELKSQFGEVVGEQQYNCNLINKEQAQLCLSPSLPLMLQANQRPHKWSSNQDIAKGLQ